MHVSIGTTDGQLPELVLASPAYSQPWVIMACDAAEACAVPAKGHGL